MTIHYNCPMKIFVSAIFILITISNLFGYVYNITVSTNLKDNLIVIEWYGPTNFTGSLYYNVSSSTNELIIQNNRPANLTDFQILGIIQYSTNNYRYSITDTLQLDRKYVIIPVVNGEYIYENITANVIPQTQHFTNTNIITNFQTNLLQTNTNITTYDTNVPTSITLTQTNLQANVSLTKASTNNTVEHTDEGLSLSKIIRDYFLKRDYRRTLEKLRIIKGEVETQEQRDLIDVYIARSYYALNKRKKAIYILLRITSEEVKPLAEFWLNRFSKYYR